MPKATPLKVELIQRCLIQADVARSAGMSESRLSRIVTGRVKPHDYEIKNLATALGIPKEDVLA